MRRVLAAVVACAMVAAALAYRAGRDGDSRDAAPHAVVCASELAEACEALAGEGGLTIEPASETADRLLTAAATADLLWLTPAPWPQMVDDSRGRTGLDPLFGPVTVVARSPLVAVGGDSASGCGWRCLGDGAADGSLRVGWPSPTSSTVGLAAAGAATVAWFGTSDVAANDFDATFLGWLAGAAGGSAGAEPVARILQSRAFFDVALGTEAEARRRLEAADPSRRAGLQLLYPEPVITVDVTLAAAGADVSVSEELASRVRRDLLAAGWRAPGSAGDPPLPSTSGLPRPGVLLALREQLQP